MRKEFKLWLTIYFLSHEKPCAYCKQYSRCNQYIKSKTIECQNLLFRQFLKERRAKKC
jgi:hypothetical protein